MVLSNDIATVQIESTTALGTLSPGDEVLKIKKMTSVTPGGLVYTLMDDTFLVNIKNIIVGKLDFEPVEVGGVQTRNSSTIKRYRIRGDEKMRIYKNIQNPN